jgi:hypothetical protein
MPMTAIRLSVLRFVADERSDQKASGGLDPVIRRDFEIA